MHQAPILDIAKTRLHVKSDYQLAKLWGLTPQHISQYRSGKNRFDSYVIHRISEALDKDPRELTAVIELSRKPAGERRVYWETILKRYAAAASVGAFIALFIGMSIEQAASATLICRPILNLCINYAQLRRWINSFRRNGANRATWPNPSEPLV